MVYSNIHLSYDKTVLARDLLYSVSNYIKGTSPIYNLQDQQMKQVETESGEVIWVGNGILDQCKPLYSYSIEDLRLASEIAEEMILKTCM